MRSFLDLFFGQPRQCLKKTVESFFPWDVDAKALFSKPSFFENSGSFKIAWNRGYGLYECVASNKGGNPHHNSCATVDLDKIHQASVKDQLLMSIGEVVDH